MKIKPLLRLLLLCCGMSATADAQIVLSEDFNVSANTTTLPTGWSVRTSAPASSTTTNGCHTTDWELVTSGGFVCSTGPFPNPTANTGSGMAGYNSWDIYSGEWSELITPAMDFSGLGTHTLDFFVFEDWGWNADSLIVMVNTSPTSVGATTLAALTPYDGNGGWYAWSQHTLNIPTTFTGTTNYIIFRGVSNYGLDIFIDDVTVTKNPPTPCSGTPMLPLVSNTPMTTPLCMGSTVTLNATDPNFPTTSGITYQWESASSATGPWTAVTGGTGATTLSYTTPALSASTWYRLALECSGSATTVYSGDYLAQIGAPQPSVIQGATIFCPGDPETFSVTAAAGTTYSWTLPSGWTGTSTSNSITATPTASGGAVTIGVTATSSCGTSIPQTLIVSPGSAPSAPTAITGNALFCANTPQTFSVPAIAGATAYNWALPSGWTGTSTTNTITVGNTITSGTVSVRATNGCGQGPATTLAVRAITALDPIAKIWGPDTVCAGTFSTYYITPVPGATSYTWILPPGWSGTTSDTMAKVFANGGTGSISVTAYVSCASTAPASKTIRVAPGVRPAVTIAPQTGTLCSGLAIQITATETGGGATPGMQWYKNGIAVSASGMTYSTNTLLPGDALQVEMSSSDKCASPAVVMSNILTPNIIPSVVPGVSINATSGETVCTGTPLHFSSTITSGGAAPEYHWLKNGAAINGAIGSSFSIASLADGDVIELQMKSDAICALYETVVSNAIKLTIRDTLVPEVTVSVSPDNIINAGDEVTFTASPVNGGLTPTYQWYRNGVSIPFATGATHTTSSLKPGDHISVRMISYLNCAFPGSVYSEDIRMEGYDLSVGATPASGSFVVYPNPSSGVLRLKADLSGLSGIRALRAEVMNTVGQVVFRSELPASASGSWEAAIELPAGLSSGQYLLQLRNAESGGAPVQLVRQFQILR